MMYSKRIVSENKYVNIYHQAGDTVKKWIENDIEYFNDVVFGKTITVDSLLCFNSNKTKLITAILTRKYWNTESDGITYFYGVNIDGNWYFFQGPFIVISREMYVSKSKIHEPLSFEMLHEIAMKEVFNGYLKKGSKGKWEVDDSFFADITSQAWCTTCHSQADWDSTYLSIVRKNWKIKK
nr:hypothetical protein [uncultured Acetobacteroides sp.]